MWHLHTKRYLKKNSELQYYNIIIDYIDRFKQDDNSNVGGSLHRLCASILFWLCLNLNYGRFLSILGEVASKVVLWILWRHTLGEQNAGFTWDVPCTASLPHRQSQHAEDRSCNTWNMGQSPSGIRSACPLRVLPVLRSQWNNNQTRVPRCSWSTL